MERFTVSASLKHKEKIRETIETLKELGVVALFPNLDSGVAKEDVTLAFMKQLEAGHFEAIVNSEALYVICPEGHVGTLVSVEVGYAHATGKAIIFSEKPEDLGLQALATTYISLDNLGELKDFIPPTSN